MYGETSGEDIICRRKGKHTCSFKRTSDGDVVTDMPFVICGWTDESLPFADGVRKAMVSIQKDTSDGVVMKVKKKNSSFGTYPSCDMLNNALRFIRDGKVDVAVEEIIFAIEKADGYFHEDNISFVNDVKARLQR